VSRIIANGSTTDIVDRASTFRKWLVGQRERDDATGDIARDVLMDECAAGLRSPRSLRRHIVREHSPICRALDAFDRAVSEWQAG